MSSILQHVSAIFQNVFKTYHMSFFSRILKTFQNKKLPTNLIVIYNSSTKTNMYLSKIHAHLHLDQNGSIVSQQHKFWYILHSQITQRSQDCVSQGKFLKISPIQKR